MLATILHKARLRMMPVVAMKVLESGSVPPKDQNTTIHPWMGKMVQVVWSKPPALGHLSEMNRLLADGPDATDPIVEHLKLLPPIVKEDVLLGVVASVLRQNPALRLKLGVPLDD